MDWINRMQKISNKFKFQLFGRKTLDLQTAYHNTFKYDSDSTGFMTQGVFNLWLNSFGVFLSTQQIRAIGDHYRELNRDINYGEFIQFIRKDISEKRLAAIQHAFEQLSDNNGISVQNLMGFFDAEMHPHHRTRTKDGQIVRKEVEAALTRRAGEKGYLNQEEFFQYFFDVNACVPHEREEYFIDIIIHGFGINEKIVTRARIRQVQLTMYQKIRDKTYIKNDEGNASKRAFRYFDLQDRGVIDYTRFKHGLDKLACYFTEAEMKAVFRKHTGGQQLMTYEMFCAMFFEMGSGKVENPNPIYEMARQSGGYITSNGMTKRAV